MFDAIRVAHVVLSLDVGGLERNVINQVREGHALGQVVSVVCLERPGTLAPQAEAQGGRLACISKPPGIRPEVFARLRCLFAELRPDVVHTHQIGSLFYAGPAARRARVPLVVHTEHGKQPYALRRRTRLLGRLAGHYASRFFCLTDDMAAAVVAHRIVPWAKVCVIRNGIDTAQFRKRGDSGSARGALGIPAGVPLVGTVGRLNEIKRQDVLLRGFAKARRRVPEAHLILVGDGPLLGELGALAEGLGCSECVHFAGYQPQTAPYLHAMDVFALTSRSEGMPQALLEASVAGLPVIASRVGGVPEVVDAGRTGLLFEPGDADALAEGLCRLLADPALARRLGDAGRDRVESLFDIRRMASEYHRHFLAMLAR